MNFVRFSTSQVRQTFQFEEVVAAANFVALDLVHLQ